MLLNHLSRPSAAHHGVLIKGEAVAQGSHSLFFIAEAADEAILQLLAPLRQAGNVEVTAAMTCAAMVSSGGCNVQWTSRQRCSIPQTPARMLSRLAFSFTASIR